MTYEQVYNLFYSAGLLNRTIVACAACATAILSEAPETANHAKRLAWANATLQDVRPVATSMIWPLLGNVTIMQLGDAVDDGSLQYIISNLIAPVFIGT
jgi:hypothetical protein